jgi:flagellin-like protein
MRKGVTPVVATVLLMTITIGAAGTLYTVIETQQQNTAAQTDTDLRLNTDQLRVESCYNQSSSTFLVVRNNGQDAVNTSEITPLTNSTTVSSYTADPEIVDPQGSFTIEFMDQFGSETLITLTAGTGNPVDYNCYQLT